MNLKSVNNFLKLLIILFVCIYPLKVYSYIQVIEENCTESNFNLNATLKNSILAKGIYKQSLEIIPHKISEQRQDALFLFFQNDPLRYVISYKTEENIVNNVPILTLNLTLDINAIKNTLINLGVYFDVGKLKCNIKTENFETDDNEILENLITLSNIEMSNSTESIKVSINKHKKDIYIGTLEFNSLKWSSTSDSLSSLWEKLWSYYFNQLSIQYKFYKEILVYAGPWATTSGFFRFYKELNSKKELLSFVELVAINFNKGVYGEFIIITSNPQKVIKLISGWFEERNLEYTIKVVDGNDN